MKTQRDFMNKKDVLNIIHSESGSISFLILYCFLLSQDKNNEYYLTSLMCLTSKISLLSKLSIGRQLSRKDYSDILTFIKSKDEISQILTNDDEVNWEVNAKGTDRMIERFYTVYSVTVGYLADLFCQDKFQKTWIAAYPLAVVLDYIFLNRGNVPDYDKEKPFYNDDLFKAYYPIEWSDNLCIPLSCSLDVISICDHDNEYMLSLLNKQYKCN